MQQRSTRNCRANFCIAASYLTAVGWNRNKVPGWADLAVLHWLLTCCIWIWYGQRTEGCNVPCSSHQDICHCHYHFLCLLWFFHLMNTFIFSSWMLSVYHFHCSAQICCALLCCENQVNTICFGCWHRVFGDIHSDRSPVQVQIQ